MSIVPLLVLPVVGGFAFCSIWKLTRYRIARQDGHKLYFSAVWYGLFLSLCSGLFHILLFVHCDPYRTALDMLSSGISNSEHEHIWGRESIISILASTLLWGPLLGYLLNVPFEAERWKWLPTKLVSLSTKAHRHVLDDILKHNHIEQLFLRSMELSLPVMVTLHCGKVYIGYPLGNVDPGEKRKSFVLLPLVSGYRNDEHRVEFTTEYEKAVEQITRDSSNNDAKNVFAVVIEADQVCTSRLFDFKIYNQHFGNGHASGAVKHANIAPTTQPSDVKSLPSRE